MDENHKMVSKVTKVLGVIALLACVVALFVPGLNIVAVGVLAGVASAGSLAGHVALAQTGHGSWWEVGMDASALATLGAGRFLGPGVKVFGRVRGGALGRSTAETKTAGAMARGNAARTPVQARVNADVAQVEQRLVGGASGRVTRGVRREVEAIRTQGVRDSQNAFDAAESAYRAHVPTMTAERKLLGGGDPDLAALRVQAKDAAQGCSPTSNVGLAAARAKTQYFRAVVPTAASSLSSVGSVWTDYQEVDWYESWKRRFVTRAGGGL